MNEILREILVKRGITSENDILEFLSDRPKKTYDPFLLFNMKAGVDLLLSEAKNGTKICIYGDYDADGVTSVCILSHVLSMLTKNFTYYIPSRFDEGYGLNKSAVKKLSHQGVGLIVTVDCGSVSYEEVELAKELGMKVIVTDHHSIDDVRADCILINPKQKECKYPFSGLAGCGVAFKMVQAIQKTEKLPKKVVTDVLDLVAIGTVADIVPLKDENRTIVKYGLNKINSNGRSSLRGLKKAISLNWITSENIAFGIAPHINAAGRMAHACEAVELLLSHDDDIISQRAGKLVKFNSERKKKQEYAYNQCLEEIDAADDFILLKMEDMHEGIAGIVAGKIKEKYNRPVIILTASGDGFLKGTGRSIPEIDIYKLLKNHEELFERFGGHKSACGLLIAEDNYSRLKVALKADMSALLLENPKIFEKKILWDVEITPEELTVDFAKTLDSLEPFGQDNPRPVFLMRNVMITGLRFMGECDDHVRFNALSQNGSKCECVLFQRAQEYKEMLLSRYPVDIIGVISVKNWRGRESTQFIVEEILTCR